MKTSPKKLLAPLDQYSQGRTYTTSPEGKNTIVTVEDIKGFDLIHVGLGLAVESIDMFHGDSHKLLHFINGVATYYLMNAEEVAYFKEKRKRK